MKDENRETSASNKLAAKRVAALKNRRRPQYKYYDETEESLTEFVGFHFQVLIATAWAESPSWRMASPQFIDQFNPIVRAAVGPLLHAPLDGDES